MRASGCRPWKIGVLVLGVLGVGAPPAAAIAPGQVLNIVGASGTLAPLAFTTGHSGLSFATLSSVSERTVSGDGRYVVFTSDADAMTGEPGGPTRIFRRDRVTNETILISRATGATGTPAATSSQSPSISDSGDLVAFVSTAQLDPADSNTSADVYVRAVTTGTTTLVSRATGGTGAVGNASSTEPEMSGDGTFVVFTSTATNLHPDDLDSAADVFRRNVVSGALRLVSRRDSDDAKSPTGGASPSIDADGDTVAFISNTPLAGEADDGTADVYVRQITGVEAGATILASRATTAAGADSAGSASAPSLDAAGTRVAFQSTGSNLDPADTDTTTDVYLRDVGTDTTTYVSRAAGAAGAACDGSCSDPLLQRDGAVSVVTFAASSAPVLTGDATVSSTVRVQRRLAGAFTNTVVSRADGPTGTIVPATGAGAGRGATPVAFETTGDAAGPDDADDFSQVYVRAGTTTELVSRPTGTAPFRRGANDSRPSVLPGGRTISADGRYVLFASEADDLLPEGVEDTSEDHLFRRDLRTGETLLAARGPGLDGFVLQDGGVGELFAMTPDARHVVFSSDDEALAAGFGAPPNERQTYRRDLATGAVVLISREDGAAGAPAGAGTFGGLAVSDDGNRVAFVSSSPGLASGQTNTDDHVFVRDVTGGRTILASRHDGPAGAALEGTDEEVALSADGSRVAFATADNGLDGDAATPDPSQVVVRDLDAGTTVVASRAPGGALANDSAERVSITADGTRVAFVSDAVNLHADDADPDESAFVTDLRTGVVTLASRTPSGAGDTEDVRYAQISPDGRFVALRADEDLVPQDTNNQDDAYVRDLEAGTTTLVSTAPDGTALGNDLDSPAISAAGRCVVFDTDARNLGGGSPTSGDYEVVAVRALTGECPAPEVPPVVVPAPQPAVTPPTTTAVDRVKPVVSKLTLLRTRFRVSAKPTATSAAARRPTPTGTSFRFTLSERATVRFTIEKVLAGRRSGARCVKPTRKLAKRKRCDRYGAGASLTRRSLATGARSVAFSGRIGRKRLTAGRYRLTVLATDPAGNRSAVRRTTFTVVTR